MKTPETVQTAAGTVNITWTTETKPARQLRYSDTFADGAIILQLSFQRTWIYARCVKAGKCTRRRFRYDQPVTVEKAEATYARTADEKYRKEG